MQVRITHADPHVGTPLVLDVLVGEDRVQTLTIRMHQSEIIDVNGAMSFVCVSPEEIAQREKDAADKAAADQQAKVRDSEAAAKAAEAQRVQQDADAQAAVDQQQADSDKAQAAADKAAAKQQAAEDRTHKRGR